MKNKQAYELAAGMGLEDIFFKLNGIDPDAICVECKDCSCNTCEDEYCKNEACYESCIVGKQLSPHERCPNDIG